METARDYCRTITANIETFLRDKTKKMTFRVENAKEDFKRFWEFVGAEGDLDAALGEWDVMHNASGKKEKGFSPKRLWNNIARILGRQTERRSRHEEGNVSAGGGARPDAGGG
jgi:hypothetical protein